MIDNVSYIYDHNLGRTVLGYCIVVLGLFTLKGFYPLDFAFCFGKKRHPKSTEEKLGDLKTVSGKMSYEAKHCTKLELALHEDDVAIVFSKHYKEPEIEPAKDCKKEKQEKWVAFLSTDTNLHASSIIKIYIKRWPVEVCFKECKQMLALGKEQSNDFNAQVFSTMASILSYNMLMYLNEKENYSTLGELFSHLVDDSALITYADRRMQLQVLHDVFYNIPHWPLSLSRKLRKSFSIHLHIALNSPVVFYFLHRCIPYTLG